MNKIKVAAGINNGCDFNLKAKNKASRNSKADKKEKILKLKL